MCRRRPSAFLSTLITAGFGEFVIVHVSVSWAKTENTSAGEVISSRQPSSSVDSVPLSLTHRMLSRSHRPAEVGGQLLPHVVTAVLRVVAVGGPRT